MSSSSPERRASPFEFEFASPFGRLSMCVRPDRTISFESGREKGRFLRFRDVEIAVSGRVRASAHAWLLSAFTGVVPSGRSMSSEDFAALKEALVASFSEGLVDGRRKLVERELVEVLRARRDRQEAMRKVQEEIDRRKAKMRVLKREAAKAEIRTETDERRLRAELAAMDGLQVPDVAGSSGERS